MKGHVLALSAVCFGTVMTAQAPPRFEWLGSCPVECCGYGATWTALQPVPAVADVPAPGAARTSAPAAFTIAAGAIVHAVTGTLYTIEKGAARVDEDFSTDATLSDFSTRHKRPVTFLAGETIELLAPREKGVYRIMKDGRVVDANLYQIGTPESCKTASARCAGIITKQPVTEWWVMVLNQERQSGWIRSPEHFARAGCR